MSHQITIVTGNKKKLEECIDILGSEFNDKVVSRNIDLPENQGTIEDIVKAKCQLAAQHVKGPVIVEDTSLCFNALGGMPGPYVKWFVNAIGPSGLFKMLDGFEEKRGYALCVFGFCSEEGGCVHLFSGRCDGIIVEPRGSNDFGWDPCFQPLEFPQTYAEMAKATKNSISHRGNALRLLKQFLLSQM